jgi:hypothetical protein
MCQVRAAVAHPKYQNNRLVADLVDEIAAFLDRTPVPALPAGQR